MSILNFRFFSTKMICKPSNKWDKYYAKEDFDFNMRNESIYSYLKRNIVKYLDNIAIEYLGRKITYEEFLEQIDSCSNNFSGLGVKKGDIVSIISTNIPEALISYYALNKIGAVVSFIHPLLSKNEIKNILNDCASVYVVCLEQVIDKLQEVIDETNVYKVIIQSVSDSMPTLARVGYKFIHKRKIKDDRYISWADFRNIKGDAKKVFTRVHTPAVIMQSGGSTGKPKSIVLSNGNIIASSMQAKRALPDLNSKDITLGILPIFHGFGLQVNIHDAFIVGAKVVLIPRFKANKFQYLINKYKPTVLIGVPTLFSLMTKFSKKVELKQLKYAIAGGDSFHTSKVEEINEFLHKNGAKTNFTQGYGLTEATSAVTFDLKYNSKPGSIGIPWPGSYIKIVRPGSTTELPIGSSGEICVCAPTVMLGYLNNEKETNETLKIHADGNVWLHTGDLGVMDFDGYLTFKGRIKRLIVTSGYNVYPNRIEEVLESHSSVLESFVVGIPDTYKNEVPMAYITLKKGCKESDKLLAELKSLCENNLAHYSVPKYFEFRKSLPKTIVGKVDFKKLQKESKR